jgi:TetR/AcrR family transcriptional regulator, fatty acid metabolism regulator protein
MTVHSAAQQGREAAKGKVADDRALKRERILDAAEHIFAQHGFFAAKVAQIADRAGVADGTIYLYFKSKDDLLISLFESRMERVNRMLAEAIAGQEPKAQLRQFIRTYLELVQNEPAAAEVMTIELRQSSKFMHDYDNPRFFEFLKLLGGIIATGQQSGQFDREVPASAVARMIFGMLDELVTSWLLSIEKKPRSSARRRDNKSGDGATHPGKKFDIVRAGDWVISVVEKGVARV